MPTIYQSDVTTDHVDGLAEAMADRLSGTSYGSLTPSHFTAFQGWWVNDLTVLALDGISAMISALDSWIDDKTTEISNCIGNNNTILDAARCIVNNWRSSLPT